MRPCSRWLHRRVPAEASAERPLVAHSDYSHAVWLICLAGVLEAAAEPAWLYAQANDLIGRRVLAEGARSFSRPSRPRGSR